MQPKLYLHFALILSKDWWDPIFFKNLLHTEAERLKMVKEMSLDFPGDLVPFSLTPSSDAVLGHDGLDWNPRELLEDAEDGYGQEKFQAMLLNPLLRMVIHQTQRDSLRSFQ